MFYAGIDAHMKSSTIWIVDRKGRKVSSSTVMTSAEGFAAGLGRWARRDSTGNATRSMIAEGFLRNLTGNRFDVASAGVEPGALNPLASEIMKEVGINISGQKPKSVAQSVKERFGYVIAICDKASERSPIFPFTLNLRQWSIVDPNTADGLPAQKAEVYRRVRDEIKDNDRQFIADTAQIKGSELSA